MTTADPTQPLAVLASGGLDSSILLGLAARRHVAVHPLYVRGGLVWEAGEEAIIQSFLKQCNLPALKPLVPLEMPVKDLYGDHWSTRGTPPDALAPDEDFYLPGRNVLLLAKALVWCRLHDVPAVALAILEANPFPDASQQFFRDFANVVSSAMGGAVKVVTPFAGMSKAEVVWRGRDLPMAATLSCVGPVDGRHCGACGKCAERGRAFLAAGVPDPTDYASNAWQGTTQRRANRRPWE